MSLLDEAQKLVNDDRQEVYGHPADDFQRIAEMSETILVSDIDPRLRHALYMIQVKIARLLNTPDHHDSLVDIIGYVLTYEKILDREKQLEEQIEYLDKEG